MPKSSFQISLNKVNVRKFSDFGKIGDCQPLLQNEPKRWSLWSNRVGQRSYHVLPQISPRAGARRSLHLTSAKWKAIKTKMNRIKQEVKQYGVLWFIIYWSTFVPLFLVFSIPYHLGWDIIGVADYLQVHGWLEWLKWIGVDGRSLIDRCRAGDNFVIFESFWRTEFTGETASMILTTVILWELMKPFRYFGYLVVCRKVVQFCRSRNIFPKFFSKY